MFKALHHHPFKFVAIHVWIPGAPPLCCSTKSKDVNKSYLCRPWRGIPAAGIDPAAILGHRRCAAARHWRRTPWCGNFLNHKRRSVLHRPSKSRPLDRWILFCGAPCHLVTSFVTPGPIPAQICRADRVPTKVCFNRTLERARLHLIIFFFSFFKLYIQFKSNRLTLIGQLRFQLHSVKLNLT